MNIRLAFFVLVLAAGASAQVHTVSVACCAFTDSTSGTSVTTVPVGTTVQWNRVNLVTNPPHTVTNGVAGQPGSGSLFNALLNPANPSFSFTFNTPGVVLYFCNFHSALGMTGTVIVTVPAAVVSTGSGCNGSSGTALTLTAVGLPQIGNGAFGLQVGGGPAGASAYVFLAGSVVAPVPVGGGCSIYLDLVSLGAFINAGLTPSGPVALDGAGTATFPFPIPSNNALMAVSLAAQGLVYDAGAPLGLVLSNALTVTVGV